jgi:hypothetical protein
VTMTRIYTFEVGSGLGMERGISALAKTADDALRLSGVTNSQLAVLFMIHLEGDATPAELEFALVMPPNLVDECLLALDALHALETASERRGRNGALKLKRRGLELLDHGIGLWRAANSHSNSPGSFEGG